MQRLTTQSEWIERARTILPAGGFGNFDPNIIIREGKGSRVWDENGKEYLDFLIGSGPMILGHGHPEVLEAVIEQAAKGMTFFASNSAGIELAEVICDAVQCADQLRFVSTGGEADMYAMRLARAHTGKNKILKFEGGYHGMSAEALMSLAPSRLQNFPRAVPDSAGIPESVGDGMLVAPFNDSDFAESLIDEHGGDLKDAAFYTDSFSDLPMLEAVHRPVCVHPDPRLKRTAIRRGWEIADWGTADAPPGQVS